MIISISVFEQKPYLSAMNRKRYIHTLSAEDKAELTAMLKTSRLHRERQRAQAILWSHQGYDMESILQLLQIDRDTLSRWYTQWEAKGMAGLRDHPRSGRPCSVSEGVKKRS